MQLFYIEIWYDNFVHLSVTACKISALFAYYLADRWLHTFLRKMVNKCFCLFCSIWVRKLTPDCFPCLWRRPRPEKELRELNTRNHFSTAPQDGYHSWGCLHTSLRLETLPPELLDTCLYVYLSVSMCQLVDIILRGCVRIFCGQICYLEYVD